MKKLSPKELHDAQKIQKIIDHLEKNTSKEEQSARAKLFAEKVAPIDPQLAAALRSAQDNRNSQESPNPLADMCYALNKCYQCGNTFPEDEQRRHQELAKPGQIFLCLLCFQDIQLYQAGDNTIQLALPFGATQLCADQYQELLSSNKQLN